MRIVALNCTPRIATGGHRRYFELVRQLAARGHSLVLIKNRRHNFSVANVNALDITAIAKRPFYSFSLHLLLRALANVGRISRACRRADWIIVYGEVHFPAALLLKLLLRSAILFDPRSNLIGELQAERRYVRMYAGTMRAAVGRMALLRLRESTIAFMADRVLFQCRHDAAAFLRRNPCLRSKYRVVANSFRISWLDWQQATERSYREFPRRLLFMGTLDERKGIMLLLQALLLLRGRSGDLRLTVAGTGEYAERVALFVAEHRLAEQVCLQGWVNDSVALMRSSDLLVVPSLYDSFPNVIIEALCVGLPVIAAKVAGIPEMLRYPELLFAAGDGQALALHLGAAIAEQGVYRRIAELCRLRRAHFDFDWAAAVEQALR